MTLLRKRNVKKYLLNKYKNIKDIIYLYKTAYKMGFDKTISLINLIENEYGHRESIRLGKPVDAFLNPIPWYTYPAIEYLKQFDFSDKNIFEYGSGNSSIFWSYLAKDVTSIESDSRWLEIINDIKPSNLIVHFKEEKLEYVNSIQVGNKLYDLIIIDGNYRDRCVNIAPKYLSVDGLIILDDSERYPKLCSILRGYDLIQVDFFGLAPIVYYTKTTSLFLSRKCKLKPLNKLPSFGIGSLCKEFDE